MSSLLRVSVLLLSLCFAHPALASTPISGTLPASTTWTKTESPYVLTGPTTLPAGSTLTLEPGVIVKMNPNLFFQISGSVLAQGSAADPVIVTSITDDTAGGDTNGDGSNTAPSAGNWYALYFLEGSSGTIAHTEFRYGGASNGPTMPLGELYNQGGELTITDSLFTNALNFALHQDSGTTSLQNSTVSHSGGGIQIVDGTFHISGNTFTDTLISIDPRVDFINHGNNTGTKGFSFGGQTAANLSGTMTHDQTWVPDGLPYVVADTLTVPALHSLTILPGATVHMTMHNLMVSGTLTSGVSGASERVTFTSPSATPQPGDWLGINFLSGSHGTFHATDLRYGAHSFGFGYFNGMIMNQGGTISMDDTTLTDAGDAAIHHESGTLAITASTIANVPLGIRVWGGTVELHDSSLHDLSAYGVYNIGTTAVDATNNWWGSFTGPTHPSHPIGTGAVVSNNVLFLPYRTIDPTDVCMVNCNSNVLFLPGIMGSRLFEESRECGIFNNEKERWVSKDDCEQARLSLDENGKSINPIYTKEGKIGVIDDAYSFNLYQSFMSDLKKWKETDDLIADYALIPYDWRLSLEDILQNGASTTGKLSYSVSQGFKDAYIYKTLKSLADSSRTHKVTIIAHSNGGLLTKALIQKLKETNDPLYDRVDKIVFVAVPQTGTPEAVSNILHGDQVGPLGAVMSTKRLRNLAQHMPSAYHLLPITQYFASEGAHVSTPVVTFEDGPATQSFISEYGYNISTSGNLISFLLGTDGRNVPEYSDVGNPSKLSPSLLGDAVDTQQKIGDAWTVSPATEIYQIAGWGIPTLARLNYRNVSTCTSSWKGGCLAYAHELTFDPKEVIDGDGTVVEPSALAMSTSSEKVKRYWVDLNEYNKLSNLNRDRVHKDILEIFELRNLIRNIIIQTTEVSLDYISTSTPVYPRDNSRLAFTLHSPLTLEFTDSDGRHIGPSTSTPDTIDFSVPRARYERYGDVQLLSIPQSTIGTLVLRGVASGSFTLDIAEQDGNTTLGTTSFEGILSSTSTMVTMNINPVVSPVANGIMLVDEDGDDIVDFSLHAEKGSIVTMPVLKLPLSVMVDSKTMLLGESLPVFTSSFSGFQNGDTSTSTVMGSPLCTTTATSGSPVGTYPITCTIGTLASDKYNFTIFNQGILTIEYKWSGFSQPINDTTYNPSQIMSVFKGGSTIPVKFQLKNANGTPVQTSSAPLFLTPLKGSTMSAAVDESTYADPGSTGNTFKYDPTAQQYIYNWSTKGLQPGYWYKLSAKLEDGTTQSVVVGIR